MLVFFLSVSVDVVVEVLKCVGYEYIIIIGEVLEFLFKCAFAFE